MPVTLSRGSVSPSAEEHEVIAAMRAEGLAPYRWDNGPFDTYAAHSHTYHKVLYCVRGSIRFVLTRENESVELRAGDRLDLEPHTEHSAFVGPDGVVCLEAQV
jgi:mannose-6-phosphate isomerase-like protein (cupin superfamily)